MTSKTSRSRKGGSAHPPKPHHAPVKIAKARASKMTSGLVALSSAAVFMVYAAGYAKTKAAADRLEEASARRPMPGDGEFGGRGRMGAPTAGGAAAPSASAAGPVAAQTSEAPPSGAAVTPSTVAPEGGGQVVARSHAADADAAPTLPAPAAPASTGAQHAAPAAAAPVAPTTAEPTAAVDHKDAEPVGAAVAAAAPVAVAEVAAAAPTAVASAAPPPAPAAPAAAPKPQAPQYKDGTYTGWGTCRHGDIQAEVIVAGGRIASARISQCWTRYTCNWLDPVVPQVVQRQSPAIDYVSGATQSTDAFYFAVLDALLKAK